MKRTTPRIDKETEKFLCKHFKNKNAGAEFLLEAIPAIAKLYAGIELKGKFIASELKLMIEAMEKRKLNAQLAGQQLPTAVLNGVSVYNFDKKLGVDAKKLFRKIKAMSTPELFFLEIWLQGFWQEQNTKALNDYIKELL